jgi:hypothetical protein
MGENHKKSQKIDNLGKERPDVNYDAGARAN